MQSDGEEARNRECADREDEQAYARWSVARCARKVRVLEAENGEKEEALAIAVAIMASRIDALRPVIMPKLRGPEASRRGCGLPLSGDES